MSRHKIIGGQKGRVGKESESEPTAAIRRPRLARATFTHNTEERDDDAVGRSTLESDDRDATRLLHHFILSRAPVETIRLLCDEFPNAVRRVTSVRKTALHVACRTGANLEIIRLLCDLWPDAITAKDDRGRTPLHEACRDDGGPSVEAAEFMVNLKPRILAEKDDSSRTPLHFACIGRSSYDGLLMFLVERYPGAIKEKDADGWFPLHLACSGKASPKVIAALADEYPRALQSQNCIGNTPLNIACYRGSTLDVVTLLIERCQSALEVRNSFNHTPLERAILCKETPPEVARVLSALHSLSNLSGNDPQILDALLLFQHVEWSLGVTLVVDAFPSVVNKLCQHLMPDILASVGRRCQLNTFYAMVLENPALVKDTAELDPAEKEGVEQKAATCTCYGVVCGDSDSIEADCQ